MWIQWVDFVDFRNYPRLHYSPSPALNVLTGPNAQGKTNLLEGLAVLLLGRSFRPARPADLVAWQAPGAVLSGELRRGGETSRILCRRVEPREDGAWALGGEGCPWARAIPFGWADLEIVTGAPQARRNFLDGFAGKLRPAHLSTVRRYRQVVGRRNHLLQQGVPPAALEPWDRQLAPLAIELGRRRREATRLLQREIGTLYPEMGGRGSVELDYRGTLAEEATEADVLDQLARRRRDEARRGQTLVGPHRDDLAIAVGGHDLRATGSRGQQRLLALALRLAEVGPVTEAVGSPPVLLLDDALSELDLEVQGRVVRHMDRGGQVFLTTAERSVPALAARWWEVRAGMVDEMAAVDAVPGAA